MTESECLAANLSWLLTESGEMPITTVLAASNCAPIALKSMACTVQPDVSSLG